MLLFPIALSVFVPLKKAALLYLFMLKGTIKVQKVTSCVTSVLFWNTQCANSSNTG